MFTLYYTSFKVYKRGLLLLITDCMTSLKSRDAGFKPVRSMKELFFLLIKVGWLLETLGPFSSDILLAHWRHRWRIWLKFFLISFCMSSLADLHARVMKSSALRSIVKLFLKERLGIIITSLLYWKLLHRCRSTRCTIAERQSSVHSRQPLWRSWDQKKKEDCAKRALWQLD